MATNQASYPHGWTVNANVTQRSIPPAHPPSLLEAREGPAPAQWQAVKDEIRLLYEKNPLRDVRRIMEQKYGFSATERMYKARLSQWGISKNYSDKDYQISSILNNSRQKSGKRQTASIIHGHKRSLRDLHKYFKGRMMTENDFLASALANIDCENQQLKQYDYSRAYTPEPETDDLIEAFISGPIDDLPLQHTFRGQSSERRERTSTIPWRPVQKSADTSKEWLGTLASKAAARGSSEVVDLAIPLLPPEKPRTSLKSLEDDSDPDIPMHLFVPGEKINAAVLMEYLNRHDQKNRKRLPVSHIQSPCTPPEVVAGRSTLPTIVNGSLYDAIADTMSSANIMTEAHAVQIGLSIDRSRRQTFKNACGVPFHSVGEVSAVVAFPDDTSQVWRDCRFAILKHCATPLIIGDVFLRLTETLTKFRHRLRKVANSAKKLWKLCYMELPRRMLDCTVDGQYVMASADTGSDVDLTSLRYARYRGWKINKISKGTGHILLADGTVKKVRGYVEVPLSIGATTISTTLYVLDGLMCDILLGDDLLDGLDAFNRFEDNFVDMSSDDDISVCHNINWQEAIDSRLDQLLQGQFPGRTVAELGQKRFHRIGLGLVSADKIIQAWQAAFARALNCLDDREVSIQLGARQEMVGLHGTDLQRKQRLETERQEKHRRRTNKIKQERDRFLGVAT